MYSCVFLVALILQDLSKSICDWKGLILFAYNTNYLLFRNKIDKFKALIYSDFSILYTVDET